MAGYIFIDKEDGGMRSQMRRNMRGGANYPMMRGGEYKRGYEMGFRHGWEDAEDDMMENDEHYRRMRDSRGRYM